MTRLPAGPETCFAAWGEFEPDSLAAPAGRKRRPFMTLPRAHLGMRGIVGDRVPAELWHDLVRLEFLRHRCPLNLSTTSETEHNRAAFPVAKAVGVNEVHYAM